MAEKNPAAVALGRMARGKRKRLTLAERARRREAMVKINSDKAIARAWNHVKPE